MGARAGLTTDGVVDLAADLVDAHGVDGLTLAAVARAAGVRTPSLYNHLDGLEGLRRELTLRAVRGLGHRIQRAAVGKAGNDAVCEIARAFRSYAVDHPGLYELTVPASDVDDDAVRAATGEVVGTVVAVLAGYGLPEDDALHAVRSLRSGVHGFVTLELAGGFGLPLSVEESFEWLLDLLTAGLTARAPAR